MSLTLSETGRDFPWDGLNEAGLSVMALALQETAIPPSTDPRPSIDSVQWLQYILDSSATLREAISNAERIRVGDHSQVHYFICDAVGECGVLEYLKGQLVIHTGSTLPYFALANNTYSDSLVYLERLFQSVTPMAILNKVSNQSLDRFSRAAIWSKSFPTNGEPVHYSFNALSNLVEAGVPWPTQWRMVFNLKQQLAYLQTASAPRIKWVRLPAFDPGCTSGARILNLNAVATGDVTRYFVPYTAEANRVLISQNKDLSPWAAAQIGVYPEKYTQCME
jgi:choloylglycine hydrolase